MSSTSVIFPGNVLDYYLGQGYYRMGQNLFTCRFLPLETGIHTVHWLRLVLAEVAYGSKQRQLLRQNARFTTAVQPFRLTIEYEALYDRYYQSIDFDANPSLASLLLDNSAHNVFDTKILEVRDNGQLIAAGVFDQGAATIAGIVNFYDPDYRKYSLGKYLLLLKTEHARRQQFAYYYPGYLVQGYPKFDYKLFACLAATEVYDCRSGEWLPFSWEVVQEQSAALRAEEAEPD
ncbi:MAG: GNAT family N-acetyltransferase [Hymenobacter sp.]|nr:MAG: GNAT family N-acetyltransferase [Hymenobacter sp.]